MDRASVYAMCLFTYPVFAVDSNRLPTEGWHMLRRPGCLVLCQGGLPVQTPKTVTHPGTNRAWHRVTASWLGFLRQKPVSAKLPRFKLVKNGKNQNAGIMGRYKEFLFTAAAVYYLKLAAVPHINHQSSCYICYLG